jgi:hypothetical protein
MYSDQDPFPRYPESNFLHLPNKEDQELEYKLKLSFCELRKIMDDAGQQWTSNISKEERAVLHKLRGKDLVYLPSDKGGEFCITTTQAYDEAAQRHLDDEAIYTRVPRMTANTIEKKISRVWKDVSNAEKVKQHVARTFVTNNSDLPTFYHLVKTHKAGPELRVRPIVSNCTGPTKKISWLLCYILKPLYRLLPAHLEDSKQLITSITELDPSVTSAYRYPISLDVKSLFTSIPPLEAIRALETKIFRHGEVNWSMRADSIRELLKVVFANTYFRFRGRVYRQTSGLPMGNSVSSVMASVYMDAIEERSLSSLNVAMYRRYVDDVFCLTTCEEEARTILDFMNSQDDNIEFELELPRQGSLSLLDFSLCFHSGNRAPPVFSFYRKPARKPVFLHYRSAVPLAAKLSCIQNERKRINRRCSSPNDTKRHQQEFDNILRTNGFPERIVCPPAAAHKRRNKRRPSETKWVYLQFPFVSDSIQRRVQAIFSRNGLPVRVFDRNHTLRAALKRKEVPKACDLEGCSIKGSKLCYIKKCVYQLRCTSCWQTYIGSTLRCLHERVREHRQQERSSVFQHQRRCGATLKAEVIARARDNTSLRFQEALLIRERKPAMNAKREVDELLSLVF